MAARTVLQPNRAIMSQRSSDEILGEALIKVSHILQKAGRELRDAEEPRLVVIERPQSPQTPLLPLNSRADRARTKQLIGYVVSLVAENMSVPTNRLGTPTKEKRICEARWLCWYILRELTDLSLPELGRIFDHNFEHTSVLYGINKLRERTAILPAEYEWVARVMQQSRDFLVNSEPPRG
jgi:hypothetical protein